MRSISFITLRLFSPILLLGLFVPAFSQGLNTWVGGTPGMENEWNCPRNWSASRVPNDLSDVFIPDVSTGSRANPEIHNGVQEVHSLFLDSNATLEIGPQATLVVMSEVVAIYPEDLKTEGLLLKWDEDLQKPGNDLARLGAVKEGKCRPCQFR